ncbi:MAG: hypothetical protein RMH75_06920 [Archaeoglobaceae archaeon]|nr:hypothetical protein [Archaeoglobaceae archaeon]
MGVSYKELIKSIEEIKGLRKNVALDLSGDFEILLALSKSFKKVYTIVNDFRKAESLNASFKEHGIRNVGIIVSERLPEFDFEFNAVVSFELMNETDFEKLKKISDFILLIDKDSYMKGKLRLKSFQGDLKG